MKLKIKNKPIPLWIMSVLFAVGALYVMYGPGNLPVYSGWRFLLGFMMLVVAVRLIMKVDEDMAQSIRSTEEDSINMIVKIPYNNTTIEFEECTIDEVNFLKEAQQCMSSQKGMVELGVGDGKGQHLVKGNYDTIKILQDKLFQMEKMYHRSAVEELMKKAYEQGRDDKNGTTPENHVNNLENLFDDYLKP